MNCHLEILIKNLRKKKKKKYQNNKKFCNNEMFN